MVTAWDIPANPLTDSFAGRLAAVEGHPLGIQAVTNTPAEVKQFAPGKMACANCHLNAGQRERSLPLVAVAGMFPEYNGGPAVSTASTIASSIASAQRERHWNGRRCVEGSRRGDAADADVERGARDRRVHHLARAWGDRWQNPAWRGQNTIPASHSFRSASWTNRKAKRFSRTLHELSWCGRAGVAVGDKSRPLWDPIPGTTEQAPLASTRLPGL